MIYEVYSYSDAILIGDVLNNVSMLMSSHAYYNAIRLGLLLGILITCTRYLFTKTFDLHYILISFVMFQILFVPTGTVSIEDVKTANVVTVDNVPLGIAASMYLTSTLGRTFTTSYDAAFRTVDADFNLGYVSPLRDLLAARKLVNTALDPVKSQNWAAYFKSCVIPYEDVIFSTKEIYGGDNILESLATDNGNVFVNLHLDDGWQIKSCKDAYTINKADAQKVYTDTFLPKAKSIFGTEDKETAELQLELAVKYIPALKHTEVTAQQFMLNLWLSKVAILSGELQYDAEIAGGAYGPAIVEAIEQRNVDAAAYGSMFGQSMPYLMAGIEIIAYGLTPMAGFLLVLGPFGMRLVLRWMLLPLWVGMWPPLTTLINWFMLRVTEHQLSAVSKPISFYGSQHLYSVLSNWYGIAGTLEGLVPAISMTFLTGSYFAFTSLANRFSETRTFDEKKLAPDFRSASPILQSSPPFSADPFRGVHVTGRPDTVHYSAVKGINNMETSSIIQTNSAKKQFSSAQNELFQNTFTEDGRYSKEKSMSFNKKISGSELESTIDSHASSFSKSNSLNESETEATKQMFGIGLTSGIASLLNVSGSAEFQKEYRLSSERSKQLATAVSHSIGNDEKLQVQNGKDLSSLIKRGNLESIARGSTSSQIENFTTSYENMVSSIKNREHVKSIVATTNTNGSYDAAQFGHVLKEAEENNDPHRRLDRIYNRYFDNGDKLREEENRVRHLYGLNGGSAERLATWNILEEASFKNPNIRRELEGYYQYAWGSKYSIENSKTPDLLRSEVDEQIHKNRNDITNERVNTTQRYETTKLKQDTLWSNREMMQQNYQETLKNVNSAKLTGSLLSVEKDAGTENFNHFVRSMIKDENSIMSSIGHTLSLPYQGQFNYHLQQYLSNRDLPADFKKYQDEAKEKGFNEDMSMIYATRQSLLTINPTSLQTLESKHPPLYQSYQDAKQNLVREHGQSGEKFIIASKMLDNDHKGKYFSLAPKMLQNIDKSLKSIKNIVENEQAKNEAKIINNLEDF